MKKALLFLLLLTALPLAAQTSSIPCGDDMIGVLMPDIDEISSPGSDVLSGTIYTVSEQVRMPAGAPGSTPTCYPQWVRAYRKHAPKSWNPPSSQIGNPMPGPTLRAKVGDMVNLTFLNSIDAAKFPDSDEGCDATNVYPGTTGDKYPDCFADSVFTNLHYHGTHTSPNTTADNVFINVRPSPRDPAKNNLPLITVADVQDNFAKFYADCNAQLQADTGPKMWPRKWSDLKEPLQTQLMGWVEKYGMKGWYAANQKLIGNGFWPQYFVGAYPYCFKLPLWTGGAATTASGAVRTPHTHGAGASEVDEAVEPSRPLLMGQAPGTHWYHAHKHGATTINVMNGMTGAFIIEGDSYDKKIRDYYGKNFKEKVLVIQQLGSVPNLVTNKRGDVNFFVNGKLKPVLQMAGNSVHMWRIANTAGRAGAYFVSPPKDTLQWKQLAIDGVQLTPDNYWNRPSSFLLMSGNRIDLLVKAPPFNTTDPSRNRIDVIVYNVIDPSERPPLDPAAKQLTLFTVEIIANGPDMQLIPKSEAPRQPDFLKDITDREITGTKILRFQTSPVSETKAFPAKHMIDGKLFDGELGAVVELNRAEEWKIVNESYAPTAISHPFHIHINPFQLTEIFDPNKVIATEGAGTVSVTEKQPTVTGTDTFFLKDFREGDSIWIGNQLAGVVSKVTDNTTMTLTGDAAATITGSKYSVVITQYTIDKATARAGQCYLDPDQENTWVPCVDKEPLEQRVWWDVFPIPSGRKFTAGGKTANIPGYFKMRSRFVDYSGYFVLHCHILAHEDRGMMTVVQVAPVQTPYSHH